MLKQGMIAIPKLPTPLRFIKSAPILAICALVVVTSSVTACSSCQRTQLVEKEPELEITEPCENNSFEMDPKNIAIARFIHLMQLGEKDAQSGKCRNATEALSSRCGSDRECTPYEIETYNMGYERVVEEVCTHASAKQIGLDDAREGKTKELCFKLRICPSFGDLKDTCVDSYKAATGKTK